MEQQILTSPEYEYSADWFSGHIPIWDQVCEYIHPEKILEIGSYEGRSACYLIETCAKSRPITLYCVDTWLGGKNHGSSVQSDEMKMVELRFDSNIAKALAKIECPCNFHKIKSPSALALPGLINSGHAGTFDLIYIDGSHRATDVLTDAVMSFQLLRVGGAMIFDDYLLHAEPWEPQDPFNIPKQAIDAFLNIFQEKMRVHPNLPLCQIYAQKTAP